MTPTQFKDALGRTWDLSLDLGKTLLVDKSDFTKITETPIVLTRYDKDVILEVLTDNSLMFAVIGVIVHDQFKDNLKSDVMQRLAVSSDQKVTIDSLSPEELEDAYQHAFVSGIKGPTIEPARTAFVEALGDFFPAARTALSAFLGRVNQYQEKIAGRLPELLGVLDQKVDSFIDEEIQKLKDGNLNDSSSATPAPSVSNGVNGNASPSESLSSATTPA